MTLQPGDILVYDGNNWVSSNYKSRTIGDFASVAARAQR